MADKRESLESIRAPNSGLLDFDANQFKKSLIELQEKQSKFTEQQALEQNKLRKYLNLFLHKNFTELQALFDEDPSFISIVELKALNVLNLICQGQGAQINLDRIFPLAKIKGGVDLISRIKFCKALIGLLEILINNIQDLDKQLINFDFYTLQDSLAEIVIYYADFLIRHSCNSEHNLQNLKKFRDTYAYQEDEDELYEGYKQNFYAQVFRLLAQLDDKENNLVQYRKLFKVLGDRSSNIRSHGNKQGFPAAETLKHWQTVLNEVDTIQREVEKIANLEQDTCGYFECSDCCSYTFPIMSLTEFRHLNKWLEDNNYPLEQIKTKSEEIQKEYQAQYGERLGVLDKSLAKNNIRGIENPHSFKYTCPFLQDDRCTCYEARPLLCRGFGLSSDNNLSIKTCNYYMKQYQHNSDFDNHRDVYDLRQTQSLARASDKFISAQEEGKESFYSGTIVAWFTQDV